MKINRFLFVISAVFLSLVFVNYCKKSTQSSEKFKWQEKSPVALVYPLLDTEHSRWFYFSSASRPFGMVNLSPDTEINGAWDSGYRYQTDTIKGFSHVHGWQISALSVMPVTISAENKTNIFTDFYSKFLHENHNYPKVKI